MSTAIKIVSYVALIVAVIVFCGTPLSIREAKNHKLGFAAFVANGLQIICLIILAGHGLGWW